MNRLTIIGNLTTDPQSRTTPSGKQVCSFSVAVNRRGKDGQQEADFFRVNVWGNMADVCAKYLAKGRKVAVVGSVTASAYTTQKGDTRASMDVFAQEVEFLSPVNQAGQNAPEGQKTIPTGYTPVDEQLPF